MVVALEHVRAAPQVRRAEQVDEGLPEPRPGRSGDRRSLGPRPLRDLVARALVGEEACWDLAHDLVFPESAQQPRVGHLADDGTGEPPPVAERLDRVEHLRPDDRDHALLALGDHHLPGLHALFPQRDAVEVEVDPGLARHLGERGGETGGAAVLQRLDEAALDELDRDLDQLVARERVTHLHARPLVRVVLAELLAREHGCPADPVATRRRAVQHDEVPRPGRARAREALRGEQPDAHRVDEDVVGVGVVEADLAADGGDADRVPVRADARDRPVEARVAVGEIEPVQQRDRARAHGDDVAQDAADAGRGALVRLDRRRVVVALDLEADGLAVAEVEHARVLTRALQHAFPRGGKPFQEERRMLVAAVLGPEEREDRELEVVRLPLEQVDDARVLPVGQAEGSVEGVFGDPGQTLSLPVPPDAFPSAEASGARQRWRNREPPSPPDASGSGGDLGVVVHADRDRVARPRPGDVDSVPPRVGGARARRLRGALRHEPHAAPAVRVATRPHGRPQHRVALLPHQLGPAVHRLRPRRHPQRLGPALHRRLRRRRRPGAARLRPQARRRDPRLRRHRRADRLRAGGR